MRICFFRLGATPLFVPESRGVFGGAEVRAFTFARALARQPTHNVSFAVAASDDLTERTVDGINVLAMPGKKSTVNKLYWSLHRRISEKPLPYAHFRLIDAEVVACFGVHDPTASVIEAARRSPTRTVLFLTSSEDVQADAVGIAKERRYHKHHHYAIRYADLIVVQTKYQKQKLLERFGRESVLIRNPIDTQIASGLDVTRQHVLWVGRSDRDSKRADICFSLARKCPKIPFVIVMNDSSPDVYRDLTETLPQNVTLHRHVPLNQIETLFATASVLVNTSDSEGFPNTFLQAAKYGVPIVSLRVDPDGMLTDHGCGAVPDNETTLSELISKVHTGGASAAAMSRAARHYVVSHHELSERANELDLAISSLLQ